MARHKSKTIVGDGCSITMTPVGHGPGEMRPEEAFDRIMSAIVRGAEYGTSDDDERASRRARRSRKAK